MLLTLPWKDRHCSVVWAMLQGAMAWVTFLTYLLRAVRCNSSLWITLDQARFEL